MNLVKAEQSKGLPRILAELVFFVDRYLNRFAVTREPLLNLQSAHDRSRAFIRDFPMVNDE